jgi:hypothetical protein
MSFSAWYFARSSSEVQVRGGWSWAKVSNVMLSVSALLES